MCASRKKGAAARGQLEGQRAFPQLLAWRLIRAVWPFKEKPPRLVVQVYDCMTPCPLVTSAHARNSDDTLLCFRLLAVVPASTRTDRHWHSHPHTHTDTYLAAAA